MTRRSCLTALPLLCATLLATSCSPKPQVVYRIPPDKQEEAARMLTDLVKHMSINSSYSPGYVMNEARKQVERIYGEPVVAGDRR